MTPIDLSPWTHDHQFHRANAAAERSTQRVMLITALAMGLEIAAGWWFNSMALLADGWHMGSHALAIGLTALTYAASRRYARDPRFAFGTWKIEILGGFVSALFLLLVAAGMVWGSVERLLSPQPIRYLEAMTVAGLGLAVNLLCAWLLGDAHRHDHPTGHGHHHHSHHAHEGHPAHPNHHHHAHRDLNLASAYLHVLADAATSVLAILALLGGWLCGWSWLDPVMGLAGAVLVAVWAKGLLQDTGRVLLDREMDHPVVDEIRAALATEPNGHHTHLTDLHVWRVGKDAYACALTVVTSDPTLTPHSVRQRLAVHGEIVHATIELHHWNAADAAPGQRRW